ncbi:MAG: haloacid dehalogenase [Tardiphaga sp.]|nr:haloacid dehalogenase [Tardiphaga sp.]
MTSFLTPHCANALLFDLGRVVLDVDVTRALACWAAHANAAPAQIAARFRQDHHYEQHEIGAIDASAYFATLRHSLGIDITDEQFLEGWNAVIIGEMPGIDALLAAAARHLPLYAFSNTNVAHAASFSAPFAKLLSHFQTVFLSSSIGLRKPDAAAYDHVVRAIGVPAARIVFFDDSNENIAGARASGLKTVHVRTPHDVADALAALGLVETK